MSPEFQATIRSSVVPDTVKEVAFGSMVYIRHDATQGGYLHSHPHYYPTGSKQQQITCYAFSDSNSLFEIKHALEQMNVTYQEKPVTGFQRVKHGDTIRLEHVATNKRLHSHDHRAPVTDKKTHNEVSGYGDPVDAGFIGDSNDHWRVDILNQDPAHPFLDAITSKFQLIHINTGCRLFSHDLKLPEWGMLSLKD